MPHFTNTSTGKEVVQAFPESVDGKTIVITGPSSGGVGAATAIALATGNPKLLILAGRTEAKIAPVIEAIGKLNTSVKIQFIKLDLGDQSSIREAAAKINSSVEKIDLLINNAGIMCLKTYQTTPEGIELQFGTNHIGHFLLTNLLMEKIFLADKGARIVNVSSMGYVLGDVPFDDVNWDNGKTYNPWLAYAASKTANILFSIGLARRLNSKGVVAITVHPGLIGTNLSNDVPSELFAEAWKMSTARNGGVPMDMSGDKKTLEQGCSTTLVAALDPQFEKSSGIFLRNCKPFDVEEYAKKPEYAERLWALSEELVEQSFPL